MESNIKLLNIKELIVIYKLRDLRYSMQIFCHFIFIIFFKNYNIILFSSITITNMMIGMLPATPPRPNSSLMYYPILQQNLYSIIHAIFIILQQTRIR